MDDLWSRIQRQNEEVEHDMREYQLRKQRNQQKLEHEARLREHEAYAASEVALRQQQQPWEQQQQWQTQQWQPTGTVSRLSAGNLRQQEREQERLAGLERSLQRGAAADGAAGRMMPARPKKLTHPERAAPEKENRGKISLLPPTTAASSCAPSTRRAPPSVAGGASTTASERLRRPVHFTHMMAKQGSASQMDDFLNPVDGIRGQMRRAGIEPKNHHRDNRQHLANLAAQRQQQQQAEAEAAEQAERQRQLLRERALSGARVPSAGRRSVRPPPTGQQPPPPAPRPHEPGHVPAYLQRRKAEWAAEEAHEAARLAAESECPPGLRLVGEEEKARILDKLAEEKAKAAVELRQMPFVIKTNASQQKKDRLEARLEEIEGAVAAYMKEKVFVPADM